MRRSPTRRSSRIGATCSAMPEGDRSGRTAAASGTAAPTASVRWSSIAAASTRPPGPTTGPASGIQKPLDDFCCVYRYAGGTKWEDCGQPGQCRRLFGLASFRGGLYVTAEDGRCYVHAGERQWRECGRFPNYAHPLGIHDGKLYAGVLNPAGVWAFDGQAVDAAGQPARSPRNAAIRFTLWRCIVANCTRRPGRKVTWSGWKRTALDRSRPAGRFAGDQRAERLQRPAVWRHDSAGRSVSLRPAVLVRGVPVEAASTGAQAHAARAIEPAPHAPEPGSPAWVFAAPVPRSGRLRVQGLRMNGPA